MKQFTNKEQTQHLIELGFPRPDSISEVNYFDEAYTTETEFEYDYSIGELIGFLEANTGIEIWYDGNYHYWYIDYDLRRVGIDKHLINALYDACVELKKEGVI